MIDVEECARATPAHVCGRPAVQGVARATADDFRVTEELGFAPDGDGEHVLLCLRKRDVNTEWLARRLAAFAGVRPVDVGYAGLKDRRAVASQWFSVALAGKAEPDWHALESKEVEVLSAARHRRKLKRGALRGNRFEIVLRDLRGDVAGLGARLERVAREGVPNYFGEQRFGRAGDNLRHAQAWFAGEQRVSDRHRRGLYLSAARSWLFNAVLDRRVRAANWNRALPGEVLMLDGTHSIFTAEAVDAEIVRRVDEQDVHPTGPLWGRGATPACDEAADLEEEVLQPFADWRAGLERAGLTQERRALRLRVGDLQWTWPAPDVLRLDFHLARGCYATAVLRELVDYTGDVT